MDESEVENLTNEVDEASTAISTQKNGSKQRVTLLDSTLLEIDPAELVQRLTAVSEDTDLTTLVRARREFEVSQASWPSGASSGPDSGARNCIEAANKPARNAFEQWNSEDGKVVEELLARAAGFSADI